MKPKEKLKPLVVDCPGCGGKSVVVNPAGRLTEHSSLSDKKGCCRSNSMTYGTHDFMGNPKNWVKV